MAPAPAKTTPLLLILLLMLHGCEATGRGQPEGGVREAACLADCHGPRRSTDAGPDEASESTSSGVSNDQAGTPTVVDVGPIAAEDAAALPPSDEGGAGDAGRSSDHDGSLHDDGERADEGAEMDSGDGSADRETCSAQSDGEAEEGTRRTFFADADGDGHGNPNASIIACLLPKGYSSTGDDCDDSSALVSPTSTEICNGLDDDCDGLVDEGHPGRECMSEANYWVCENGVLREFECPADNAPCSLGECLPACTEGEERCTITGDYATCGKDAKWSIAVPCGAGEQCDLSRDGCTDITPFTIGATESASGATVRSDEDRLYLVPITVQEDVLLDSMHVRLADETTGGRFWMGIYLSNGALPGELYPFTNSSFRDVGHLEESTSYTLRPLEDRIILAGGSVYWLALRSQLDQGEVLQLEADLDKDSSVLVTSANNLNGTAVVTYLPPRVYGPEQSNDRIAMWVTVHRPVD